MSISDLYGHGLPVISFEFFPPKTDAGFKSLYRTVEDLKKLGPGYVSVTMGAGGSTRAKTVDLVVKIQREIGLRGMAHLPCLGFERDGLLQILDALEAGGVRNVLALRGDRPADDSGFVHPADGFDYANDLTAFIRERGGFSIGGACYPEKHPEAADANVDLDNLVRKVESGSEFLITQLFFDNQKFFDFVDRARAAGIDKPIVPGIMPILSATGIRRMLGLCGGTLPSELETALTEAGDNDEATRELGIRWATEQCKELIDRGVPGIHFYTLNKTDATRRIYKTLF